MGGICARMELARDILNFTVTYPPLPSWELGSHSFSSRSRRSRRIVNRRRLPVRRIVLVANQRQFLPRLLGLALPVPHTGIKPVRCQKLRVSSALGDAALIEHDDLVGADDGGEPMRDHQRGAVARHPFQRLLNL